MSFPRKREAILKDITNGFHNTEQAIKRKNRFPLARE
jgi:hypothetical protein